MIASRLQDLVERLSEDTSALVRSEIDLIKSELTDRAKSFGRAAAFGVIALVLLVFAMVGLLLGAIYGLAESSLALWASALIVGGVLLLLAALLGLFAVRAVKSASQKPEQSIAEAKETVHAIAEEVRS
jgi:uncharacterized membrane protein YqjE